MTKIIIKHNMSIRETLHVATIGITETYPDAIVPEKGWRAVEA